MKGYTFLIVVLVTFLFGCTGQILKECNDYVCLEEAALKCEPAKGNYHDVYIEIKEGPNVVATSPLSDQKVKSKTCSLYIRNSEGKERTCNIPEILMNIELEKYNDFFFSPLISEQLCSGDPVRINYGKNIATSSTPENLSSSETSGVQPQIVCEFSWPQKIIVNGIAHPCPWERPYCYNPGVSEGKTKCCNWNEADGYSNCEDQIY